MPETVTRVGAKTKVGTLVGVIFIGAVMMAGLGYTVYKSAYKNEPILPESVVRREEPEISIKDMFPMMIYKAGWPRRVSGVPSRVTVADVDKDQKPEIIFGTSEHYIYAINPDGSEVPNWPIEIKEYDGASVPAISNNGEVVIATKKNLYVFDGEAQIKNGFPKEVDLTRENSPILADVYGDAKEEILIYDNAKIYLMNEDGSLVGGWPRNVPGKLTSVAVGDLDNNGKDDIVYTTFSEGKVFSWAVKSDGEEITKFQKEFLINSEHVSVALGDIDGSGDLDIALNSYSGNVAVVANSGKLMFSNLIEENLSPLALGDVNGDGNLNIVVAGIEKIHVLNDMGEDIDGWPKKTTREKVEFINLADMDGDEKVDILGTSFDRIYMWKSNGEYVKDSWPLVTETDGGNFLTYPTLADIDEDGVLEVLSSLSDESIYIWNLSDLYEKSGESWWPMARADKRNSGSVLQE